MILNELKKENERVNSQLLDYSSHVTDNELTILIDTNEQYLIY